MQLHRRLDSYIGPTPPHRGLGSAQRAVRTASGASARRAPCRTWSARPPTPVVVDVVATGSDSSSGAGDANDRGVGNIGSSGGGAAGLAPGALPTSSPSSSAPATGSAPPGAPRRRPLRGTVLTAALLGAAGAAAIPPLHLHDTCEDALTALAAVGALALAPLGPRCGRLPGPGRRGLAAVLLAATLTALAAALLLRLAPQPRAWACMAALVATVPLQAFAAAWAAVAERGRGARAPASEQLQLQAGGPAEAACGPAKASRARLTRRAADFAIAVARAVLLGALALEPSAPPLERGLALAGGGVWLLAAAGATRGARALAAGARGSGGSSQACRQAGAGAGGGQAVPSFQAA
jgi:hypothetical protein